MAQYTNQAQLSYKNTVLNSNVAVGEILEVLSASKTAVRDRYSRNDDVTYVISIVNSGTTAFTGLTVSDNLGAYEFNGGTLYPLEYAEGSVRVYINGVLQTAPPTVTSLQPLVFSGLSLPANSNMTIIYEAVTTRFAPLSAAGTITNTATISGDGAGSPVTATATVTAKAEPDLTINKSIEPAVVTENGTVTYTFTIQNYGNTATAAADNVSVTDTFDPVLSNLSVAFNGTAWTEGTEYTYNAGTGLFTTVPGQITIPAATYAQDAETGIWSITPGTGILTVRGTL
ncbi:MAG: hypothetical protein MR884_10310 [Clostridiales bacterium]|jgi:uncharacterized repeat protein (TIGR01451 family)|nr:hypothetical protein [Clostridiales bacterium]